MEVNAMYASSGNNIFALFTLHCLCANMIRPKIRAEEKKHSLTAQVLHQYELHIRLDEQVNTMFNMIYVLLLLLSLQFSFLILSPFITIILFYSIEKYFRVSFVAVPFPPHIFNIFNALP